MSHCSTPRYLKTLLLLTSTLHMVLPLILEARYCFAGLCIFFRLLSFLTLFVISTVLFCLQCISLLNTLNLKKKDTENLDIIVIITIRATVFIETTLNYRAN